jgi:hypothetical protein
MRRLIQLILLVVLAAASAWAQIEAMGQRTQALTGAKDTLTVFVYNTKTGLGMPYYTVYVSTT